MSNGIYKVTEIINESFRAEGFRTITWGELQEKDLNKQNIFPLINITLLNRVFRPSTETITVSLFFFDIVYKGKPLDPRTTKNEMSSVDNTEDIFQDLGYRINRAWNGLKLDTNLVAELPDTLTITAHYELAQNGLAAYDCSFEITLQGGDVC